MLQTNPASLGQEARFRGKFVSARFSMCSWGINHPLSGEKTSHQKLVFSLTLRLSSTITSTNDLIKGYSRDMTNFGEKLRKAREKKGLSRIELTRKIGVNSNVIYSLEVTNRDPRWKTLQLICLALGVSTDDFRDPSLKLE